MIWIVLAVVVLALVSGAHLQDRRLYPVRPSAPFVPIFIIDNGFHIDFAIPRAALLRPGAPSAAAVAAMPDSPWVLIGWGDASYYRGSVGRSRLLDALRALFMPGNAALIRMEPLMQGPADLYVPGAVTALRLSPAGFERMAQRLDRSYTTNGGQPVIVEARPGRRPEFYFASVEHFGIGKSCAHWSSQLLQAAGLPTHRFFDGLVFGLMWDLRLRGGVRPHQGAR